MQAAKKVMVLAESIRAAADPVKNYFFDFIISSIVCVVTVRVRNSYFVLLGMVLLYG